MLKDGANVLQKPISTVCNLSVLQGVVPDGCKVVKLKFIFKKGKKIYPSNCRLTTSKPANIGPQDVPRTSPSNVTGRPLKTLFDHPGDVLI